jgi:hypothetical protein
VLLRISKQFIGIKHQIEPTYNQLKTSYPQTIVHENSGFAQFSAHRVITENLEIWQLQNHTLGNAHEREHIV